MNKRILISLTIIGTVAILAIGGTVAFFSDKEISSGNTFTAGSIDLKIDNECYYNGEPIDDCTWELTDLDGHLFFDFEDLKPGDWGEDTVSLHVYDNDAWGCVAFCNVVSDDNSCTEPELEAEPACMPGYDGELAENLYFVFWADDGDNIYEPETEHIIMAGPASDVMPNRTYALADSENENVFTGYIEPLKGNHDYYIGKIWCFGDLEWNEYTPSTEWYCNGEEVGNEAQTDTLTGDIIFYVEQSRNNSGFVCPNLCSQE